MPGFKQKVENVMAAAFAAAAAQMTGSESVINPQVHASQHADFQADAAMGLARELKKNPREIATAVVDILRSDTAASIVIANAEVAGPGFINIDLNSEWIAEQLGKMAADQRLGVPLADKQTIVVDYSAPNVAKEMHVGHLRSTIIGDACVRLMEWLGHDVLRRNHIGDWGTPFGMLIEHLLDIGESQATQELSVGDLNGFYKTAREKFEATDEFKTRARSRVVLLQSGDDETLRLWKLLIEQSQNYFISVYERMDVRLDGSEFYGESAYNDSLQPTLDELTKKDLIVQDDGAECLYPAGFTNREDKPLPLIVRKTDGGYGYAATDLAALRNRLLDLGADRILYVVGAPQKQHLEMVYEGGRMAGWLSPPATAEHISFGSVLGSDGKMFKSRSGDTIKLAQLLDEAVTRAASVIEKKNPDLNEAERQAVAQAVGMGAIKYADLSSERTRDYVFDFDQMLALEGNTAPYLQYAHARIQSILRQAPAAELESAATTELLLEHETERELAMTLLQFQDAVEEVSESLLFHRLASYLFTLATAYSRFYNQCPVLKAEDESTRHSRLRLCSVTTSTLVAGLSLLGIKAPDRM